MSQPAFAHDLSSDGQQSSLGCVSSDALPPADEQLPYPKVSERRSLDQEPFNRIHHLEQALDQALICLEELRSQAKDQAILEVQLAKTEEFANVQQQAITCLKQQLHQHDQVLCRYDQLVLQLLWVVISREAIAPPVGQRAPSSSVEPDLPKQLTLDFAGESSTPPHQAEDLEAQLVVAHQQIQELMQQMAQLEGQTKSISLPADDQQVLELTLRQTKQLATERASTIAALQKDLAIAQIKVEELEIQIAKQLKVQAKWQQHSQELEAERDLHHTRLMALEQEVAAMQEQIFQQARQASEYETAVQHWKDRYLSSQRLITQLKELIDQVLPLSESDLETPMSRMPALKDLLNTLQLLATTDISEPVPMSAVPSPRFNKLDLPDFLIRRRNYRSR